MNEEMIKKYNIRLSTGKDKLVVNGKIGKSQKDKEYVKAHKDEIVDILIQKEKQEEYERNEYRRKIESIEGLIQLESLISDWSKYNNDMSRFIERDCTGKPPTKPEVTVEEMSEKYPRAAAYIKADRWSYSAHYYKSSCGTRAKEAILNGENYEDAISDMKSAWKKYTEEHID